MDEAFSDAENFSNFASLLPLAEVSYTSISSFGCSELHPVKTITKKEQINKFLCLIRLFCYIAQLLSEIQALREKIQSQDAVIDQLQADKIEIEKTTAVNQLLNEGKISPNEEAVARDAFDMKLQGKDSFWTMFSERPVNSVVPMNTIGHGASGQEVNKESLNLKIRKLSEEKGISYSQALTEFRVNHPQEYNQAFGV